MHSVTDNVVLSPTHIDVFPLMTTSLKFATFTYAVSVQPFDARATSEYSPVSDTLIEGVVAPVLHT